MILKRVFLVVLCILILGAIPAHAAETRAIPVTPTLTFDGTTALCGVTVSSYGKSISVDLELWCGDTLVDEWTKAGTSVVTINKTCIAISGKTYTLRVNGTVGNELISGSISKKCS